MTIGCMRTGSSYLKPGEFGNRGYKGLFRAGYMEMLMEDHPYSGQPLSPGRVLVSERVAVLHFAAATRPSRGESGLIVPWSKHLQSAFDSVPHLPPQMAIRS